MFDFPVFLMLIVNEIRLVADRAVLNKVLLLAKGMLWYYVSSSSDLTIILKSFILLDFWANYSGNKSPSSY